MCFGYLSNFRSEHLIKILKLYFEKTIDEQRRKEKEIREQKMLEEKLEKQREKELKEQQRKIEREEKGK